MLGLDGNEDAENGLDWLRRQSWQLCIEEEMGLEGVVATTMYGTHDVATEEDDVCQLGQVLIRSDL